MKVFQRLFKFLAVIFLLLAVVQFYLWDKYTVPIMMYHKVEYASTPQADVVGPENFEKQMRYLKDHGYRVMTLDALVEDIKAGKRPSHKSVVITFDDGNENHYTLAFPVLKKYRFPVTMFVSPGFFGYEGFLGWEEIKAMQKEGVVYGSHGMTQAYLPDVSLEERKYEIEESKRVLEKGLGQRIDYYAYPVGGFSPEIKDMLKAAGYKGGCTTNRGTDRFDKDIYELNRIRFSDADNSGFILWGKLSGYYNLSRKLKGAY